ncbi:ABC transporter ATP-binding protein [Pseudonocardia sp. MCCB 268]|nr:ABC transporter ATP-binding protein [Pseudonocardia cytotoxica]
MVALVMLPVRSGDQRDPARAVPGDLVSPAARDRDITRSRDRDRRPGRQGLGQEGREIAALGRQAHRLYGERLRAAGLTAQLNPA